MPCGRSRRSSLRRWALAGALALLALPAGEPAAADVRAEFVGEKAGIHERTRTYGAHAGRLDDDALPDLVVVRHYDDFPGVYLNGRPEVGVFEDVHETAFPPDRQPNRDRHDCPFGDVNADGLTDVYCTVGGRSGGNGPNPNELWLQLPGPEIAFARSDDAGFRLAAARDRFGRGRDADFIDANGDEFPDLYVLNAYPRQDGRSGASRLFINEGGESFRNAPELGANRVIGAQSLQVVDFNGDGWDDLLVCGRKGVVLLRNLRGGGFRDVSGRARLRMPCGHATLAQADADAGGRLDLFRLSGRLLTVHRLRGDRRFGPPIYRRKVRYGDQMAVGTMDANARADVYVQRRGPYNQDRRDLLLLNRRRGQAFERLAIPQLRQGRGDSVEPIDHDANGLTDVVVMNGYRKAAGPVELLALYPD